MGKYSDAVGEFHPRADERAATVQRRFMAPEQSGIRLMQRAEDEPGPPKIVGYGAVFYNGKADTEYELWPGVVERVMPGAFDRALREDNPVALRNHDVNVLLGRKSAGTLSLSVDGVGLRYEIDPPDTEAARETITSIERGELLGSSFGFVPRTIDRRTEDKQDILEIRDVELWDVSPVVFPAYDGTTTGVRCAERDIEGMRREHEEWKREQQAPRLRAIAAARGRRARALEVA
jgi:HK97 family phage prohead protease